MVLICCRVNWSIRPFGEYLCTGMDYIEGQWPGDGGKWLSHSVSMVRSHLCLVLGTQFKKEVMKQQKPPADRYRDAHRLRARDLQGEAGELNFFGLMKRRQRGEITAIYNYWKGSYEDTGAKFHQVVPDDIAGDSSHIQSLGISRWALGKCFL